MFHNFLVKRLAEYNDFTPQGFAKKFGILPTNDNVLAAEPQDFVDDPHREVGYHLGRIHFFMDEPDDEHIEVCGDNNALIIFDGNHRFMAAFLKGDERIPCIMSGSPDKSLIRYLEGVSDIKLYVDNRGLL